MDQPNTGNVTFSFVSPVYNEEAGLQQFYDRLKAVADSLNEPYEIIFVNDGSTDLTGQVLDGLMLRDSHVKVVEFSRNFGHQMALTAGYDFAGGKAVISLDSDCQHPPELIPELVAKWREGCEVVYTIRNRMPGQSRLYRAMVRLGYRIIASAVGTDVTNQADFRLLDRKAVDAVKAHREHGRFLRGLVRHVGFRQAAVRFSAEPRAAGRRTYSLKQTMGLSANGVFNFTVRPLRLATTLGVLLLALSGLYAAASLALWPMGISAGPWVHAVMAVAGLFGLHFIMLGVVGEYIGRIFEEAKGRPLYIVRRTCGFEKPAEQQPQPERPSERRFAVYT